MERVSDIDRKLADYIYHDLSPEECRELEKQLHEDPDLMESYRLNDRVKKHLAARVRLEEMRSDPDLAEAERLAEIAFRSDSGPEHALAGEQTTRSGFVRGWFMYAAAFAATIAILLAVRVFLFTDADRLYESYYKPLEASNYVQRGTANELYEDIADGINSYLAGEYRQSIRQFGKLGSNAGAEAEVKFFTGLSRMGLGQYQQAEEILESYVAGNSRYLPEALWYLSLCHLKTDEIEKAAACLDQLASFDGMYRENAYDLAKKLRRISK